MEEALEYLKNLALSEKENTKIDFSKYATKRALELFEKGTRNDNFARLLR